MSEFISILISFIFMSLAESVDSFFNNKISIDAIIVCSSLFSINLLGKSLGELCTYTYSGCTHDKIQHTSQNTIQEFAYPPLFSAFQS